MVLLTAPDASFFTFTATSATAFPSGSDIVPEIIGAAAAPAGCWACA
jgi:hypothetical protein